MTAAKASARQTVKLAWLLQDGSIFRGTYDFASPDFDWGRDYQRPNLPPQDLVVYEMCVRSFTADESSGLPDGKRGTFLGLKDKVASP